MMNYKIIKFNFKFYIIAILLFYFIIHYNNEFNNPTNIPELLYYKNQSLNLFFASKKCPSSLFFLSEYQDHNISSHIKKINLKDKNYFITFFENEPNYEQYLELLEKHNLIRSHFNFGKNNLYLSQIIINPLFQNKNNVYDLNKYQKVCQYLNAPIIFQKDSLYKSYSLMKNLFFEDYNFMPETYYYPEQIDIIVNKFKNYQLNLSDLWIVKPVNGAGGHDISFLKSFENIQLKEFIITKYIDNINLINNKKYDLRLYVLISGLKPLRIYFYKEGLIRIATEQYFLNESSIENNYIHLTNVEINKYSKNYILPNTTEDEQANSWNIFMYKKFLKRYNIEWDNLREKIKDIIIKSIISVYNNLNIENERKNLNDLIFYNLLGFDILIDNEFIPKLIEINKNPSVKYLNNLDKKFKTNLFVDTLNLIGIIPYSRKTEVPLNNKFKFRNEIDEQINNAICELKRPKGDFDLIFPTKETINKYNKYFINNTEVNKRFWNQIINFD